MTIHDLNRDQLDELKANAVYDKAVYAGRFPSWGELAEAPATATDSELVELYGDVEFTPEDFAACAT